MNPFASHGESVSPNRKLKIDPRLGGERVATGLEKKMQEKQRLSAGYRRARKKLRAETIEQEPRLRDFARYVRTIEPETADELIDAITTSWLPGSAQPVRMLALEIVSRRCDRINRRFGIGPLDDPLPPETSVFFRAQAVLRSQGIL